MEVKINQESDKIRKIKDASILIGLICLGVFLHIYHSHKLQTFKPPLEPASGSQHQNKAPLSSAQSAQSVPHSIISRTGDLL